MNTYTCPSCGGQKATPVNENQYRCEYCGQVFTPPMPKPAPAPAPPQYAAQPTYQQQPPAQPQYTPQTNGKSRTTAAILGIILGGIGVHHFYLGHTGKGILYLIFCWTYIPALIGFIEGIIYLTQSDEEFFKKQLG